MADLVRMSPPTLSKGRMWAALLVILFGQFVVSIDLTVLNMALPDLTKDLNPTSDQLLWIVDVYSLVLAGLIVATSAMSDRIGRKKALLLGFFIFGLGSALVMIAESPEAVIAIRALLGVAGALIMPITISMVRSIFLDPKERAFAIAAWSAIAALGMVAGPLVGGFLLDHFSWHAAFLVNVPFMAVALIMGIFTLPEVKVINPGKFDWAASFIFLAGMVAFLWGIKHVAAELEFDTPGIAALVIGVILLALFIMRTVKSKTPLVELSLFRSKTFTAGVIATMGSTFAMAVLLYLLSQWLQLVNGDTPLEAGLRLVPMAIASLVGAAGSSMLAMKLQARNVVAGGMVIAALAMFLMVFYGDDLNVDIVIVATTLVGLGSGALALGASLMMCETPVEKASSAGGLQEVSYDLGNVLGVSVLGSVASIIYRESLNVSQLREMGLDSQTIGYVEQSFSTAAEIANQTGLTALLDQGAKAFNDSVVFTCLVGGIIILVVAVAVWALIPRDVTISEDTETRKQGATATGMAPLGAAPAVQAQTAMPAAPSIPLDEETLRRMDAVCRRMGITPEMALSMFAHKVAYEQRIPFKLEFDPLYNAPTIDALLHSAGQLGAGHCVREVGKSGKVKRMWSTDAWDAYERAMQESPAKAARIETLVKSIAKEGEAKGAGKPKRLEGALAGMWSRRIDGQDYLVYRVMGGIVQIVSCTAGSAGR